MRGAGDVSEKRSRKVAVRDLLGLLISVLSLAAFIWWALNQRRPQFPDTPQDLAYVALAIGLYGVATLARGWRWHRILLRAGIHHEPADAYCLTVVGYMGNTILPARGGEVLRILLLGERTTSSRREILGSIVAERVLDAGVLVVLFAALTWSGVAGTHKGRLPAAIGLGLIAVGAVVLFFYISLRKRGKLERFAEILRPFLRASRLLFGKLGVLLGFLTAGIWVLEGVIFWIIARSLHLSIDVLQGTFLTVLTSFFLLVPAAPGYIGTFDAALVVGLRAVGITGGQALAFVLLTRFVLFVPVTLAGLVLMLLRYGGLRWLPSRSGRYAARAYVAGRVLVTGAGGFVGGHLRGPGGAACAARGRRPRPRTRWRGGAPRASSRGRPSRRSSSVAASWADAADTLARERHRDSQRAGSGRRGAAHGPRAVCLHRRGLRQRGGGSDAGGRAGGAGVAVRRQQGGRRDRLRPGRAGQASTSWSRVRSITKARAATSGLRSARGRSRSRGSRPRAAAPCSLATSLPSATSTDVRDVCRAYQLLLDPEVPAGTYNVASGGAVSMQRVLELLVDLASGPIAVEEDSTRLRPAEIPRLAGDASKLRAATGWKPRIPLEQTLRDTLEHARKTVPERVS